MNHNQIKGSYYIRIRPSGWYVWYQTSNEGKRAFEKVADLALPELGFKSSMSVDDAKARCVQLNKERSLIREKIRISAKRVTSIQSTNEVLFPQADLAEFQELITDENFGSDYYLKNLNYQFNYIQKMCTKLRIQPFEYKDSSKKIYKYFISQKTSPSYSQKLISFLNRWGKFKSKKTQSYFEPVPSPKGNEISAIAEAQQTKTGKDTELGVRTASLPLSPEKLNAAKEKFSEAQYNWLKISIWFGLRPEEIDELHNSKAFKIEFNQERNVPVLHVYQSKLRKIAANRRWKAIPVLFKEQKECLDLIKNGIFERPLHKTVRRHIGRGFTLYAGRKGFTDLMLKKGQTIFQISIWMGHKNINRTLNDYKDRTLVDFTETSEVKRISLAN